MPESTQHKLDRVRPPRVQITYDVEIGDAIVMKELPFVVGIMADLTGNRTAEIPERPDPASDNGKTRPALKPAADELKPLRERKYVEIDRDNFNEIMKSIRPRLSFTVDAMTSERYVDEKEADERKRNKWRPVAEKDEAGNPKALKVELDFQNLDDFGPIHVIKQVPALREILEARNRLDDLLTKLDGNDKLEKKLKALIEATEDERKKVREAVGAPAPEGGK
ncbi:MAG TPA: type VI secretion system contractile sheath small subunit [Pyrinomonadaceae bacterium]|jgi:type VI secretion system protein ImpB|nr:type VI secretion system contractile sheath small subunit [Pyrinomonadaceae bacterium]